MTQYEGHMVATENARLALQKVEETLKLLSNEKNCAYVRQALEDCKRSLEYELQARAYWKWEGSQPYYGG